MFDPLITKKLIQSVVLEFGAIVTSNGEDGGIELPLHLICKVDDGLLSLTLELEEVDPSVTSKVVNNHQTVLLPTKNIMRWRPKKIHVKKLQAPLSGDLIENLVGLLMHLPFYTCLAHMIFGKGNVF